jgi:hypothetical protein
MAMLDRYQKSGGFMQLLHLVETSGPVKQDKFIEMIEAEDARWALAIRVKKIDMNRIYTWRDEVIVEIIGAIQDLTLAVMIMSSEEPARSRVISLLSHGRQRKIEDLTHAHNPTAQEIATTHAKVIETVRKLAIENILRFENFDPDLYIETEIEDKLAKGTAKIHFANQAKVAPKHEEPLRMNEKPLEPKQSPPTLSAVKAIDKKAVPELAVERAVDLGEGDSKLELKKLRTKIGELSQENAVLRHELTMAKAKLDQIKKIA